MIRLNILFIYIIANNTYKMFKFYNWEEINISWDTLNLNWEEIGILISEVLPNVSFPPLSGGGGVSKEALTKLNKLPEEKKRIIIKIVCKIKGEEEYISYKYKNNKKIKITAKDINIIVDKISNSIKVNITNIS